MNIKFRVWNKKDNQMIDWFTLTQNAWNTFIGENPLSLLYEVLVARKDDFEVMQFTGLTDKNGKEIYEGDIITFEDDPPGVVKWDSDFSCWVCFESDEIISESDIFDWCQLIKRQCKHYIVIGNIYDNPELLQ